MSRPRAVLFCPGRGSYGREELGSLAKALRAGAVADALARADERRAREGLPGIRALDAADAFKPGTHLEGRNAAALIYFATLASLDALSERYEILAVAGNSLGWYTALAASGMLDPTTGHDLVHAMAELQQQAKGGQILTSVVGDDWLPDARARDELDRALAAVNALGADHLVAASIHLGGHEVLAGTELGVQELLRRLQRRKVGEREFPFRLAGHGPFHTELCLGVAERALPILAGLPASQPRMHLLDGRGIVHSPWSADPRALLAYTATTQVVQTFDFGACVRVAMREFQPDVLLCAGPGTSLRAPVGHMVLRERWRGIADKKALFASELVRAS